MDFIWDSAFAWVQSHFHFYVSPFWYWVFIGSVVSAFMTLLAFFFPPLRSFAGAIVLGVIVGLAGYRRGEYDQYRKQKAEAKAKQSAKPRDQWKRW